MNEAGLEKKRVLLVDDDPIVLKIYRHGLGRQGFEVATAEDGLVAISALRTARPDVVVLDLMMPRFSGSEVLDYIRAQPDLANLPVIVLSNAYMDALAWDAATKGAEKGLLKVRCTPAILAGAIKELLEGRNVEPDISDLLAAPSDERKPVSMPIAPSAAGQEQEASAVPMPPTESSTPAPPPPQSRPDAQARDEEARLKQEARAAFLGRLGETSAGLRKTFEAVQETKTEQQLQLGLEACYRRVHFFSAEAALSGCPRVALLASALEALILQVMDKPARFTPSVLRTLGRSVGLLAPPKGQMLDARPAELPAAEILVVDDDPLSNRLVVSALRQLQLRARSVEKPETALQLLSEKHYDLLLLDIQLPGISGFELCRQLRRMPGYQTTPLIYVTARNDFEIQAKSLESGAEDLISKPVLPMELAVKVVMHLVKR